MRTGLLWLPQIFSAIILFIMGGMKLTGSDMPVMLFTEIGMEPTGRIITGVLEVSAAILLVIPASGAYGAVLGTGIMTGAIIGHLTTIGIEGDRMMLFGMALAVFTANIVVIILRHDEVPFIKHMFAKEKKSQ